MESFKKAVLEYTQLDETNTALNAQLKDIQQKKRDLSEQILKHMNAHNVDSCNLPNGDTLVIKSRIQIGSLNKEYMQETLNEFFKNPIPKDSAKAAEQTTDAIMSNRESSTKQVLKVQKKK